MEEIYQAVRPQVLSYGMYHSVSGSLGRSRFVYGAVAVGGTFDIIHAGHKRLLSIAFERGEKVFIGVSGNRLVSKFHKSHRVRSFSTRARNLRKFLKSKGWLKRARIVELRDPYGPSTRRKRLDALIVTRSTLANGERVNSIRRRKGLPSLRLHVVNLLLAEDGLPISATRIRRGEIDSSGKTIQIGRKPL